MDVWIRQVVNPLKRMISRLFGLSKRYRKLWLVCLSLSTGIVSLLAFLSTWLSGRYLFISDSFHSLSLSSSSSSSLNRILRESSRTSPGFCRHRLREFSSGSVCLRPESCILFCVWFTWESKRFKISFPRNSLEFFRFPLLRILLNRANVHALVDEQKLSFSSKIGFVDEYI